MVSFDTIHASRISERGLSTTCPAGQSAGRKGVRISSLPNEYSARPTVFSQTHVVQTKMEHDSTLKHFFQWVPPRLYALLSFAFRASWHKSWTLFLGPQLLQRTPFRPASALVLLTTLLAIFNLSACHFDSENGADPDDNDPNVPYAMDAGGDGGGDASSPCGECSGQTPVCNTPSQTCVACLENTDCSDAATPVCDTATKTCVGCLANADCTNPTASICNLSNRTCEPCVTANDCSHLTGLGVCDEGTCVACTVNDESACNGNSCNPTTHACTTTAIDSVEICNTCVADSECDGTDTYCVPMEFSPVGQTSQQIGSYCLQKVPGTGCVNPFKTGISRTTVSGETGLTFCGVVESLTTCPAVLELVAPPADPSCATSDECGIMSLDDGVCDVLTTTGTTTVCTYTCDSSDQCPSDKPCPIGGGYCGQP